MRKPTPLSQRSNLDANAASSADHGTDGLDELRGRIPEGWGKWVSCEPGWYPLILELNNSLSNIDPDYQVHQIKEKWGALVFYFRPMGLTLTGEQIRQMDALVADAEKRSTRICEICGESGSLVKHAGYWMTRCPECLRAETAPSGAHT